MPEKRRHIKHITRERVSVGDRTGKQRDRLSDGLFYDRVYVGRLSWKEYNCLDIIIQEGCKNISISIIADYLGIQHLSCGRFLRTMINMNLIERVHLDDGTEFANRSKRYSDVVYSITDFGYQVFIEADQHMLDVVDKKIEPVSRVRYLRLKSLEENSPCLAT